MNVLTFWQHPTQSLTFIILALAIITLWIRRVPWIWGSIALLAFLFGYRAKIVSLEALIPIAFLLICFGVLTHQIKGFARLVIALIAILISISMMFHYIPGFQSWKLAENITIGKDAIPYSLYWNFDKAIIGLIILGVYHPVLQTPKEWGKMLLRAILLILIGIPLLIFLANKFHFAQFDPKFTWLVIPWALSNLFFTTIPEEAFYRGFLQKEIVDHLENRFSGVLGILIVSISFALSHFFFIFSLKYVSLVFVAGLIYGTIYHITKSVEGSILCHFLFNLTHFLFFTYPALQS